MMAAVGGITAVSGRRIATLFARSCVYVESPLNSSGTIELQGGSLMSRFTRTVCAAGAALAVATTAVALSASASAASSAPATKTVTLRPVTSTHHAAARYHVVTASGSPIDCQNAPASRVAVDPNIVECGPAYQYAVACWHAARPRFALCLRNPFGREVDRIRALHFSSGHVSPRRHPAPFGLVLDNGAKCTIRNGGAWGSPKQHPAWVGFYSCTRVGFVWAPASSRIGINQSHASWTVWTSRGNRVHLHHVLKASFVGTKS